MMEPILPAFVERVRQTQRHKPKIRFVSNVTGTWITEAEAMDPEYWGRHLRGTVRFSDGVRTLLEHESEPILLEVGPGNTLASLARQHVQGEGSAAVASLRHPREAHPDRAFLLRALGKLWLAGVKIDWARGARGRTPPAGRDADLPVRAAAVLGRAEPRARRSSTTSGRASP